MTELIDRNKLIAFLQPQIPNVVRSAFPNAKREGSGWRLGDISGSKGKSCKIFADGGFHDFADPQQKGSIIDLYALVFDLTKSGNVLQAVAEHSGYISSARTQGHDAKPGRLIEKYLYQDIHQKRILEIGRFELVDHRGEALRCPTTGKLRKTFRPIDENGKLSTFPVELKNFRPLYQQAVLAHMPDVTIVEGERAADKLGSKGYCGTTWPGGTGCPPEKVDWSPLKGITVYLWPDKDEAGHRHMRKVGAALKGIAANVLWIEPPEALPEKGDVVDAIELRLSLAEIHAAAVPFEATLKTQQKPGDVFERPAPQFNAHLLGEAADWVIQYAERFNCPIDFVVSPLFAVFSAIAGKVFEIDVDGCGYTLPVCIWSWSIGAPGAKKSPPASPMMKILDAIEDRWRLTHEERVDTEIDALKAKHAGCKNTTDLDVAQFKLDLEPLQLERKRPPRLKATDVTREKLASLEENASRGMVVHFDELIGWLDGMSGYSGQDARAFYLQSFDGKSFTFDRVNEERTGRIDRHLLAIHGGIQPDVLAATILKGRDDGLAARALLFWPDKVPVKPIVRGLEMDISGLEAAIEKLANVPFASEQGTYKLSLSDDALNLLNDWRIDIDEPRKGGQGKLASALAKMENQLLRLAGLLAILDFAFSDAGGVPTEIAGDVMERAIDLVESYFVQQIERVYTDVDLSSEERMARNILRIVKMKGLPEFERGDVLRKLRPEGCRAKGAEKTRDAALAILVEARAVVEETVPGSSRKVYRLC